MAKNRSELREIIVTSLYQVILYINNDMEFDVEAIIKENMPIQNEFVNQTVHGVLINLEELTVVVNKYLNNWTLDRLGKIDQAILLLGAYELLKTDTPQVVVINEAVELSKKFSDDEVKGLINGVLDKIYHEEVES